MCICICIRAYKYALDTSMHSTNEYLLGRSGWDKIGAVFSGTACTRVLTGTSSTCVPSPLPSPFVPQGDVCWDIAT